MGEHAPSQFHRISAGKGVVCMCVCVCLSHVFATLWTIAYLVPLSMKFSRQEYWSGLPFPSPGDLRDPEVKPSSPELHADYLPSEPPGKGRVSVL